MLVEFIKKRKEKKIKIFNKTISFLKLTAKIIKKITETKFGKKENKLVEATRKKEKERKNESNQ